MTDSAKRDRGEESGTHAAAGPAPGAGELEQLGDRARDPAPAGVADALPAMLPLAIPESERRGAGRPVNSPNIRTNKTFQIAAAKYGDPLIAEIALGNMPTRELIKELRSVASDAGLKLGGTVMDVLRFQADCRRASLPFGHAKRAPVNEIGETVPPVLGLGRVEVKADGDVHVHVGHSIEDRVAAARVIEHEPDQSLSEGQNEKSHGE
jgi:hypothetical protein